MIMKDFSILTTLIKRKLAENGCCFIKYNDCVLVLSPVPQTDLCMVLTYISLDNLEHTFIPISTLQTDNIAGHTTAIRHVDFKSEIPTLDIMLVLANSLLHDNRY